VNSNDFANLKSQITDIISNQLKWKK
jgi:hypothetical protein